MKGRAAAKETVGYFQEQHLRQSEEIFMNLTSQKVSIHLTTRRLCEGINKYYPDNNR